MADRNTALDILISRELPAPGAAQPTGFDPLTGVPISNPPAQTITQHVPARRYDPSVRDETKADAGSYFGLNDSRYLVRQDTIHPWAVKAVFTDESGTRRHVVGVRHYQAQGHIAGALIELIGRT